jgi:aspartate racemase
MRKLGLIGGLGPPATIQYYQQLIKIPAQEMLIIHADVDRVLKDVELGDRLGLAAYLARLIDRLARGGAEVAAISAITPHTCIRELQSISPLPLVNIVEEVAAEIRCRDYRKVALFGTRFVVQSRMFGMLEGIDVIVPEQVETIHNAYIDVVKGKAEGRDILACIARELPVDAIVLAGTDLASVFNESNTDFPHIDSVKVHIAGIARALQVQS